MLKEWSVLVSVDLIGIILQLNLAKLLARW